MKQAVFTWLIFCAGVGGSLAATPKGDPDPARADAAESAWSPVQTLINASHLPFSAKNGGYQLLPRTHDEYMRWLESTRRTLREVGLSFYDAYGDDPRRWEWFVKTIENPPSYLRDMGRDEDLVARWLQGRLLEETAPRAELDEDASKAWNLRYQQIRTALFTATDSTAQQRATVRANELRHQYLLDTRGEADGPPVDWGKWRQEVLAFGRQFPENGDEVRNLTELIVTRTQKSDAAELEGFYAALRASPNPAQRALAAAPDILAVARKVPMQMRFTAIDGREVDLATLRGKPVLIDFGAFTWCSICRMERPQIRALYEKYHEQGLQIVGITCEEKVEDRAYVLEVLQRERLPWPHYFDGRGMHNEFVQRFGLAGIPEYFLLDGRGLLIWRRQSSKEGIRELEPLIREQLGLRADNGAQ